MMFYKVIVYQIVNLIWL